ncbi:hypothetical protein F5X99DRAFT_344633 [Biscogniauxia marginata]|nr:hypothetical protein F5X99DRAFT_344633 [Biscogniauxia marginata]
MYGCMVLFSYVAGLGGLGWIWSGLPERLERGTKPKVFVQVIQVAGKSIRRTVHVILGNVVCMDIVIRRKPSTAVIPPIVMYA